MYSRNILNQIKATFEMLKEQTASDIHCQFQVTFPAIFIPYYLQKRIS